MHEVLGRRPWLLPSALAIIAGCTSAAPGPEGTDEDAALPPAPDDSCARFELQFSSGSCPEDECASPLCVCGETTIECTPSMHDRCLTALNCTVGCGAQDITLLRCAIQVLSCTVDAECPGGLCVVATGVTNGQCESGERGARCRNDQDCRVGNCVAGEGGTRACSPGGADDLCNRSRDCESGRCALTGSALYGNCVPSGPTDEL